MMRHLEIYLLCGIYWCSFNKLTHEQFCEYAEYIWKGGLFCITGVYCLAYVSSTLSKWVSSIFIHVVLILYVVCWHWWLNICILNIFLLVYFDVRLLEPTAVSAFWSSCITWCCIFISVYNFIVIVIKILKRLSLFPFMIFGMHFTLLETKITGPAFILFLWYNSAHALFSAIWIILC